MTRLDHLRAYVLQLAADMNAAGQFKGAGSDKLEAAARAILAGGGAMARALLDDLRTLGGEGKSMAEVAARGFVERMAGAAVDRLFEQGVKIVKGRAPKRDDQQRVAEQFMGMGKR